ncbi:MAG TPA: biopolymer transporter ExbD [Anaeromyxobacteraceae bacterium]|nr:biopolymer transporter ExbD [Anaeromyxobacteraceae bacterium]
MGGGVSLEQGGGGKRKKRALDATINVVPAIDLLSCCISFLLFTAVWTQISRLQAAPVGNGAPDVQPVKTLTVTLTMGNAGYVLATSAGAQIEIPAAGRTPEGGPLFDVKGLGERLKKLKGEFPDQAAITVAADDAVLYADLIHTIDACVGAGLANVSVMGAG